ncbi:MAG: pyrimidine 5'-nucleotidase [Anaerolineales bacterium]|nr:pyrimidine 5'-nucleotidase [Anaerolineales bacterium]
MKKFEILFIDVDETLYPKSNGLWQAISDRINGYLVDRLDLPIEDAKIIRQEYLDLYGTTLEGLRQNYNVDPADYLEYVHDIPVEEMIQPDPAIRDTFLKLDLMCVIFTNASAQHAERILRHLNISDLITQIIDILALGFHNKPHPEAYERALTIVGDPDPGVCMLVDDRIRNLIPAKDLGMRTILVGDGAITPEVDYAIPTIKELGVIPGMPTREKGKMEEIGQDEN